MVFRGKRGGINRRQQGMMGVPNEPRFLLILCMSSFPVQVDRSLRPQRLMTKSLVPTTFLLKIGPVTIFTGKSLRTRLVTKTTYI